MTFNEEDPRLTAYVLGELAAEETAEVETLLDGDSDAREFVDSLQATSMILGESLQDMTLDSDIGEMRRARIAKAASSESGSSVKRWALYALLVVAAAAAFALLAVPKVEKVSSELAYSEGSRPEFQSMSAVTPAKEGKSDLLAAQSEKEESRDEAPVSEAIQNKAVLSVLTGLGGPNGAFSGMSGIDQGTDLGKSIADGNKSYGYVGDGNNTYKSADSRVGSEQADDGSGRDRMSGEAYRQLSALGYFGGGLISPRQSHVEPAIDRAFVTVKKDPLSTFSVDVDTASYSQIRRSINSGWLPQPAQVRIEEMLNYFSYEYAPAEGAAPFGATGEVAQAPWNTKHKLVRIGIKAKEIADGRRRRANLVFLLDVSGSMSGKDKLPLLKNSFGLLLDALDAEDRIAIVVYAGASGLALPSTPVAKRSKILRSLRRLKSGGSTNGGAGIELAYKIAQENFIEGGVNRVILATDGDFNVGTTNRADLVRLIEDSAKKDVFLTVLGVGMSSYGDSTMETLADKGNGNYAYIDTLNEAKKVLVEQLQGTLVTVAKDVKLQVEFNPKRVAKYRLIGYENRRLANEDFRDDSVDAGEIGAGHRVTALYEIVPVGGNPEIELRYQKNTELGAESTTTTTAAAADSGELLTIKIRYKEPTGTKSTLFDIPVADTNTGFRDASVDFRFASAVAAFAMILRQSKHKGDASLAQVEDWASLAQGPDAHGYRAEFVRLVRRAKRLRQ